MDTLDPQLISDGVTAAWLALIQDGAVDIGQSGAYVAGLLAIITTLLSAYSLTQKGRVDDLKTVAAESAKSHAVLLASCEAREEKRVGKAETREDAAMERVTKMTEISSQTAHALGEFGGVLKESVLGTQANRAMIEAGTREMADMKRDLAEIKQRVTKG